MGNKWKKYQTVTEGSAPLLPPYDDPYWVLSDSYIETSKSNRNTDQFNRLKMKYPKWADDLMRCYPTYYGILGVLKGENAETLREHYELEKNFSVFPDSIIEEAFSVLSDTVRRIKYNEFLTLFLKISIYLSPDKKAEVTRIHHEFVRQGKLFRKLSGLKTSHHDYLLLIAKGMPDIFELSGLDRDCSDKDIEKYCSDRDELSLLISSIIKDPDLREQFIFASDYYENEILPRAQEKRNLQKEVWSTFSQPILRKVMHMTLTTSEQIFGIIERIEKNVNDNHDWKKYLPPSDESFYSVLGVSEEIVTLPKIELESTLRSQYRTLERTPVVNLAYSVLKNPVSREEYIWMFENYEVRIIFEGLESLEDDEEYVYEDEDEYDDDDDDDFFDEVSAEEILALLRRLQMGKK